MNQVEIFGDISGKKMKYWGGYFDESLYSGIDPDLSIPKVPQFQPILAIHSSNKQSLEFLVPIFPGRINPRHNTLEEGEPQEWALRIRKALSAYRFLEWVEPHLIYTQTQAEVLKEFLSQKREVRRVIERLARVPRYPTPEDRIIIEEELRQKLLEAKSKTVTTGHLPEPERLAGIFDAKAYLGIYDTRRQDRLSLYPEYQAYAGLVSTQTGLLKGIYREYGGTEPVEYGQRKGRYDGPSYLWQLSGYGLIKFLEVIEPFLIFRQTQARLIIDFLRVKRALNRQTSETGLLQTIFKDDPIIQAQRNAVFESYLERWKEISI